jgi:hypothetical protein
VQLSKLELLIASIIVGVGLALGGQLLMIGKQALMAFMVGQ